MRKTWHFRLNTKFLSTNLLVVRPFALQGMPQLRDAFASSVLYCGGYKAQHIVTLLHGQRRLEGAVEVC